MRVPDSLESLMTEGIITDVVRPLMSGKEAEVYLVEAAGEQRVAKVYKEAINRSFKHRAEYTEGRGVRNSRDARAMQKRSKHGRAMDEEAWRSAEVDIIHRLRRAGVRVPEPFQFVDGVLIMELVRDAEGRPAPRLGDVRLGPREARAVFDHLLREVTRMLCAGVVHGDLSDFNVLLGAGGPVIIDFPQSVDAARNQNARTLLVRDVDNLTEFLSRHEPAMRKRPYGQELWAAHERCELTPDMTLTGAWKADVKAIDTTAMLDEIRTVEREEQRRRASRGLAPIGQKGPTFTGRPPGRGATPAPPPAAQPAAAPSRRRRRRRARGNGNGTGAQASTASVQRRDGPPAEHGRSGAAVVPERPQPRQGSWDGRGPGGGTKSRGPRRSGPIVTREPPKRT